MYFTIRANFKIIKWSLLQLNISKECKFMLSVRYNMKWCHSFLWLMDDIIHWWQGNCRQHSSSLSFSCDNWREIIALYVYVLLFREDDMYVNKNVLFLWVNDCGCGCEWRNIKVVRRYSRCFREELESQLFIRNWPIC